MNILFVYFYSGRWANTKIGELSCFVTQHWQARMSSNFCLHVYHSLCVSLLLLVWQQSASRRQKEGGSGNISSLSLCEEGRDGGGHADERFAHSGHQRGGGSSGLDSTGLFKHGFSLFEPAAPRGFCFAECWGIALVWDRFSSVREPVTCSQIIVVIYCVSCRVSSLWLSSPVCRYFVKWPLAALFICCAVSSLLFCWRAFLMEAPQMRFSCG